MFFLLLLLISTVSCSSTYKKKTNKRKTSGKLVMQESWGRRYYRLYTKESQCLEGKKKEYLKNKSPWQKQKPNIRRILRRSTWPFLFFKTECNKSVTTSRVLHLLSAASHGWLQLLVALLLQPAVVVLLAGQWSAVHVMVSVEPLLLHGQPLELSWLGMHGLQLVGCRHGRRQTSW